MKALRHPSNGNRFLRRGFTLIELLVVIAILAILAALLFPALRGATLPALKAKCANNLHQLQIASSTYADEHDAKYPSAIRDYGFPHEFKNITNMLGPYLPTPRSQFAFCPGPLSRVRNSKSPLYDSNYTTYQYFNMTNAAQGVFKITMPNESKSSTIPSGVALWGCLTSQKDAGIALSHGEPLVAEPISGMNAAYPDGRVVWVDPAKLQNYWSYNGDYLWPKELYTP